MSHLDQKAKYPPRADVFHDALIVAAAQEAGCDTLFSEDMQHGRKFGGLAIVNPFIEGGG